MKNAFKVLFIVLLVLLVGCTDTNSQKAGANNITTAKSYDRWMTVKMNDEIEFQIPPNLEIQNDNYKNMVKKVDPHGFNILNAPGRKRMVVQQKGLNYFSKEALSHYVRAVLEIFEFPDEFPKFGEPLNLSNKEVEEFGNMVVQEGREIPLTSGGKTEIMKITAVTTPARVVRVNGVECIFVAYDSKLGNRPVVKNDVYFFFNRRKIYRLMTMIRSTEFSLWTGGNTDIRNIVRTIKLAN